MNIAFVSSQGGHSGQIKLIFDSKTIEGNNAIFVTETPSKDLSPKRNSFNKKFTTYYFKKDWLFVYPHRYIIETFQMITLFKKEKIDLVITNGAQMSIPAVIAARFLGIKSIFMDTVIRVKSPNWSARVCYPLCNRFFVQHKSMIAKYGRKAEYHGGVL
jgi:beta-1,4-N-acetylglucosaminyltransferase